MSFCGATVTANKLANLPICLDRWIYHLLIADWADIDQKNYRWRR